MAAYQWRIGCTFSIDANEVGAEIERLQKDVGESISPHQLLQHARTSNGPLHQLFEWDDHEAAVAHRVNQARSVLRSIVRINVYIRAGSPPTKFRAFANVRTEDKARVYAPIVTALNNRDMRAQLIERGWRELRSWCDRHEALPEMDSVRCMIEDLLLDRRSAA